MPPPRYLSAEGVAGQPMVQLGVSIEPLEVLTNLAQASTSLTGQDRFDFAHKIAKDLFNFMSSL